MAFNDLSQFRYIERQFVIANINEAYLTLQAFS
jgi:hypothetical protein